MSDVIEPSRSEIGNQAVAFAFAAQIDDAVARLDIIEQTDFPIDLSSQFFIRAGGEDQGASEALLFAQKLQETDTKGKPVDIRHHRRSEPMLEKRAAPHPPNRQFEQRRRFRPGQHEQRFDQGIRAQQGAIEIDDERHGIRCGCLRGIAACDGVRVRQKNHFANRSAPFFHGRRCVNPVLPWYSSRCSTYQS